MIHFKRSRPCIEFDTQYVIDVVSGEVCYLPWQKEYFAKRNAALDVLRREWVGLDKNVNFTLYVAT